MTKENSELLKEFKKNIPSPSEIAKTAIDEGLSGKSGNPEFIKTNFSKLVEGLQVGAYNTYLSGQKKAWAQAIRHYCKTHLKEDSKLEEVISFLEGSLGDFDAFFLSVSQSRRTRAGSTFEDIIKELFKRLDYPFDEQAVINGKPDFLMPSKAYYEKNAPECIIFTAKRTLRERWRQIVTEGTRGRGFFLATIDEDISANGLEEMKANRIYLVVPSSLKTGNPHYNSAGNVISFEDFFEDHLDPAIKRWKKAGVI